MPVLHHASILTGDLDSTVSFYKDVLGMQVCSASHAANKCWMRDASGAGTIGLEILGPPFTGTFQESYARYGALRDHLAFQVDDVEGWYQKLVARGAHSLEKPTETNGILEANVRLANGLVIQFVHFLDQNAAPDFAGESDPGISNKNCLHHFSLSAPTLDPLLDFFGQEMDMRIVLDQREDCQVFMADERSIAARAGDTASIELMMPSGWDHIDNFLEKYGTGIDHICFIVPDVDAAYDEITAKGVEFTDPPVDFSGSRVAFFNDPNGLAIEIELPIFKEMFTV
jgi:catechol 2,3-dioxygenase-like lactoylglutathione lyase family enzyme